MENENNKGDQVYTVVAKIILIVLAVIAAGGAVWRMVSSDKSVLDHMDNTTLLYLGIAGALLLLREVKSLAFGDYKVEFDRVKAVAAEAKNTAENAQAAAMGVGRIETKESDAAIASETDRKEEGQDDPWKGMFDGESKRNNRELQAEVLSLPGSENYYSICLRVISTQPKLDPLQGSVQFFLHPTFRNDRPIVRVGPNGVAELKLTAWGAFTVGAITDNGKTKLELDLAQLETAPLEFRSR